MDTSHHSHACVLLSKYLPINVIPNMSFIYHTHIVEHDYILFFLRNLDLLLQFLMCTMWFRTLFKKKHYDYVCERNYERFTVVFLNKLYIIYLFSLLI